MKEKIINNIQLITVCLILVLSFINVNIYNKLNYCLDKKNQYPRKTLELADYSSSIEGEGEDINITLQQSLLNTSVISISNISNPTINTFYEPCPKVENFNSSLVNITIEDIYAPNKSFIVEDDYSSRIISVINYHYLSFTARGCGYIENITLRVNRTSGTTTTLELYLYNSKNVSGQPRPNNPLSLNPIATGNIIIDNDHFYNFTGIHSFFNCSETFNNTFFIRLVKQGIGPDIELYGILDLLDPDDQIVLDMNGDLVRIPVIDYTVDAFFKISFAPCIYPSNTSLNIEVDYINTGNQDFTNQPAATSFEVAGDGYLEKVSIFGRNFDSSFDAVVNVFLYNSTWNSITKKNEPERLSELLLDTLTMPIGGANKWHNISHQHEFLNNSKTANNTWFIGVSEYGKGDGRWFYLDDLDYGFGTDNDNETISYEFSGGSWILISNLASGCPSVDLKLKIDLSPLENVPRPENIGLKINNSAVIGFIDIYGSGYWISTDVYSCPSGQLEFELSADWWDVSYKITKVQINYSKTDIKANSLFKVLGSKQNVMWNISRSGGLNYFDSRLSDYRISFTIPSNWNNINVFNGITNKSEDISISSSKNGYRIVKVSNAGNGTYWHLTATSVNMIELIEMYIDSTLTSVVNYADIVNFNAIFKEELAENNGIINLMIYNPAMINNKLNFSSSNSTFNSGSEFYLGKWDLSDTVVEYGEFRVQVFWNNDTAAGFIEKILTVMGQTDLTLVAPDQGITYFSNQSFNIVIYYKDSNQLKAIDGATIQYNIDGQGSKSTNINNGTIGYYVIPVNCSIFTTNGTKTVEITATKNYYENQTLNYNFNIIIVEEKETPAGEFPLAIIIITITSIVGGLGVAAATFFLIRKKRRISVDT